MFTYMLIMLFFGLLMFITFFLGGGAADVDHEISVGDAGHDFGHEIHPDAHGDSHSGLLQGWLSIKVISAFGTGFGAFGLLATIVGLPHGWVIACALGSGLLLAALIRQLIQVMRKSECTTSFTRQQLVGSYGTVTMGILDNQIGEVQFILNGESLSMPAKSQDGKSVLQGRRVVAVSAGAVMIVQAV